MFYVVPIVEVFVTSFTQWDGFNAPRFNGIRNYINLFNKMMNEVRDKVICFPALNYQNLLRVNSKRFFPGAVGVVGTCFACSILMCRYSLCSEAALCGGILFQLLRRANAAGDQASNRDRS